MEEKEKCKGCPECVPCLCIPFHFTGTAQERGQGEKRKLAFSDLDKAMVFILENILGYLKSKNSEIDEKTVITYKYYKNPEDFNGDI